MSLAIPIGLGEPPMSPAVRRLLYQLLALGVLLVGVLLIAQNTQDNLQRLGVQSGTGFLWERAGFEINQKLIPFDADATVARALGVACLNTVLLCALAVLLATLVGACVGILRLSRSWPARCLATAFVETFRNTPLLLQVFFWYFVVLHALPDVQHYSLGFFDAIQLNNRGLFLPMPQLESGWVLLLAALAAAVAGVSLAKRISRAVQDRTGRYFPAWLFWLAGLALVLAALQLFGTGRLDWTTPARGRFGFVGGYVLRPEFLALVVALSLYNASYVAEIVRSALIAIPAAQSEAAYALGLPRARVLRLVLLPQALRIISPPLTTVYQNILKSSALGAAIAYPELVSVLIGTVNNLVGQPVVIMAITLILYLSFSICIAGMMQWHEWRKARWQ